MAEHIQVVGKAPGFGSKLGNSIKGILFGIILFMAAFPVLWWGENRQNLAEFVRKGQEITASGMPSVAAGTLVKTTGTLSSEEEISDAEYLINLGTIKALRLERRVEMYAWAEDKKTRKEGDKEITTYDYNRKWMSSPDNSANFYEPVGHQNPLMGVQAASFKVSTLAIGSLPVDAGAVTYYGLNDLSLTEAMLKTGRDKPLQLAGGAIYIPNGPVTAAAPIPTEATYPGVDSVPQDGVLGKNRNVVAKPEVGDLRIQYSYFPAGVKGAVVGDWDGSQIAVHLYGGSDTFLGVYAGSLPQFEGFLQSQHTMITWIIRIVTLFMMWIGLNMLFGPVLLVMDSIPILGQVGKGVISMVTGAIAFVLWLLTLVLANLWLILLVVVLLMAGLMYYRKKQAATTVAG